MGMETYSEIADVAGRMIAHGVVEPARAWDAARRIVAPRWYERAIDWAIDAIDRLVDEHPCECEG